mmetsp:Transcript_16241/g.47674  ORF Transcript_16241/g.47674 Transcript_16241/m.47674 type:complete len:390 (-) Transcript_16241:129-1298(-)
MEVASWRRRLAAAVVALLAAGTDGVGPGDAVYDGVLRDGGDGRLDALLLPPFPSSHGSMVEQLGTDGSLVMAWFSGSGEGQDGVSIVLAQLPAEEVHEGGVWSNATAISTRPGYSNQNPVLHFEPDATGQGWLHVFHSQQPADQGESNSTIWYLKSTVDGDPACFGEWSSATEIFSEPGSYVRNRIVQELDGSWLLPMYYSLHGDGGTDYSHIKTLPGNGGDPSAPGDWIDVDLPRSDNLVQPTTVRVREGEALLTSYYRDKRSRRVYVSHSADDGSTWTPARRTTLPNNDAAIEAWTMRSGCIVMVLNPQTNSRDPLSIILSKDGGRTWPYQRVLEYEDGTQEFSYPSVREDRTLDGVIHVSYTYKRETIKYSRITEAWIMQQQGNGL